MAISMPDVSGMNNFSAAMLYATSGIHVFPVRVRSKVPATSHGQDDATTDASRIMSWFRDSPNRNIGIACELSGLFVVDIDIKPEGRKPNGETIPAKHGDLSWWELVGDLDRTGWRLIETPGVVIEVPPTLTVRTWSGGVQLYFAQDPERFLTNSAGRLGKDLDTRGNGFVVAPPSEVGERDAYPTLPAARYAVLSHDPVLPVPEWLHEALRPTGPCTDADVEIDFATTADPLEFPPATHDEVLEHVRELCAEVVDAPEGQGNDTLSRQAYMIGQYVGAGQLTEVEAQQHLTDAIADWSYSRAGDAERQISTISRQLTAGQRNPRTWNATVIPTGPDLEEEAEHLDPLHLPTDWSTDVGQAWRLAGKMRGKWMFVVGIGWYRWTGKVWRECPTEEVQQFIQSRYQWMFNKAIEKTRENPDHLVIAEAIAKFLSNSKIKAIIERLHVEKGILESSVEALDSQPDLLNTPDGVVNMRTGKLSPHDPELKMTKMTRGSYRPGYTHPDWNAALTALPPQIADYMQLRMGQAATGYIPESDDVMFLVGGGSNGKSAWTTDGIFPALGLYAMLANPHLISNHSTSGATPERAGLRGGRFVLIEELPEGGHLKAEEIKRITGTSRIRARQLYMSEIEFTASHTLVVTTNYTPQVKETDEGTWRRLLRIPFECRYVQNPSAPHERKGDPGLRLRLREGRDGQHDAIITWIIEGAKRYFDDPSSIIIEKRPDAVQAATDAWRMQSDRVLAYLGERVELDPDSRVAKADLYADFCTWLNEGGYGKWSQETFFVRFLAHESVKGRLEIKQTKSRDGISRPGGASNPFLADLPKVPRVVCGLRFRAE